MAFALGVAAGDLFAQCLDVGYGISAILFAAVIAIVAIASFGCKVNAILALGITYIFTARTSAAVTDIAHTRSRVGSSLTAVHLAGLTRVELAFALLLAAAAGGLVLFLGLIERRRIFAIATALGATRGQLRGLVAEATVLTAAGVAAGAALGWLLSQVLVQVLTGVFDPPPATLTIPWMYLGATVLVTLGALGIAAAGALRQGRRAPLGALRAL